MAESTQAKYISFTSDVRSTVASVRRFSGAGVTWRRLPSLLSSTAREKAVHRLQNGRETIRTSGAFP